MASTLTWQKGVHLGLRACAVVGREHPELAVVVVGGGPAAAALAEEVRRAAPQLRAHFLGEGDRKSTRLNSSHDQISYAVFCLKKKRNTRGHPNRLRSTNGRGGS